MKNDALMVPLELACELVDFLQNCREDMDIDDGLVDSFTELYEANLIARGIINVD